MFFPKQTIRELFDMPLEEPSGSSVPSAPEDEEETVASKQTHILEQVTKEGAVFRANGYILCCFSVWWACQRRENCSCCFSDYSCPLIVVSKLLIDWLTWFHREQDLEFSDPGLHSSSVSTFFFFFGHTHSSQKFPGQGSNPCHCSDSTRSLTCCIPRELSIVLFFFLFPHLQCVKVPRLGVKLEL